MAFRFNHGLAHAGADLLFQVRDGPLRLLCDQLCPAVSCLFAAIHQGRFKFQAETVFVEVIVIEVAAGYEEVAPWLFWP